MALSEAERAVRAWAARLGRVFGISREDYRGIVELQGGRCPICGKPVPDPDVPAGARRFPVDHNHKTGEVRGVPCEYCNRRRIGAWTDTEMLRRLLAYLEDPPARRYFGSPVIVPGHGKRKRRKKRAPVS
jgi:DNA-directed RNA polymerase subunit RPC12/RpoP